MSSKLKVSDMLARAFAAEGVEVLFTLMGQYSTNWPALTAGLTLSVVPVIVVYVRMQRQFVAGMMLGAVKN